MKNYYLILLLLLSSFYATAQIEFDNNFKQIGDAKLPYGEAVTLSGKVEGTLDSLLVTVSYQIFSSDGSQGVKKIRKKADVQQSNWNIVINPLPADSRISITFDSYVVIDDEKKKELNKLLEANFQHTVTEFTSGAIKINDDPDVAKKKIAESFAITLDDKFKSYNISKDKTLFDGIVSFVREQGTTELLNYINNSSKAKKFLSDYAAIVSKVKGDTIKINSKKISEYTQDELLGEEGFALALEKMKNSAKDNTVKNEFDDLLNLYKGTGVYVGEKSYSVRFQEVKEFQENAGALEKLKLMVSNSVNISSNTESVESNELLKYAGIDIGAVVFPKSKGDRNPAFVGYLFCISPYLHEIFGEIPKKKIFANLTPTLGVGLTTSLADVKAPFFYTGISYKLNKAFRFTTGATFFKNDIKKPEFEWMFGAGFTLELSNVGNLLRLFNSAKAQFSSSDTN